MGLINIDSDEKFKEIILKDSSIIMIHKTGCPYCAKAKPWLKDLAKEFKDKIIASVNKDNIPNVMKNFQVEMYPTFVSFKSGKVENIFFGDTVYEKVRDFIVKN